MIASRNPTQRDADRRQFLNGLDSDVDRDDFRMRGWRSAVNARAIFSFWEGIVPGSLPRLEDIAADQGHDLPALLRAAGHG